MEKTDPNCSAQTDSVEKLDATFMVEFYRHQYEQRWRGSRNQDWTVLGVVSALLASCVLFYLEVWGMQAASGIVRALMFLPAIIVVLAAICGLKVLSMHQIVMLHADSIGVGIAAYFGVNQCKSSEAELQRPGYATEVMPQKLSAGVRVLNGREVFEYPSKKDFEKALGIDERKAVGILNIWKRDNVQGVIGRLYYL